MTETNEQIAKYQEWASRLEANIQDMKRQRTTSWAYLAGGIAASVIGWRFSHFLGGSLLTLGIVLWSTALYITWMRIWYYRNELKRTRFELDRLLEGQHPAGA